MSYDVFGDLREWDRVLGQVERMRRDGTAGEHQAGLARLVRYPHNWQLRQAALRAAAGLAHPADEVLRAAARVMADKAGDLETRVLAARAVGSILANGNGSIGEGARSEAARFIGDLLAVPHEPVLQECARQARACLPAAPQEVA